MTDSCLAVLRRSLQIAFDRPRVTAWTLVAVTCAFVIAGAAFVARDNAKRFSASSETTGGSMVVYLGEGVGETAGRQLAAQLAATPGVERAELVTAIESANRLAQALSADAALLEGVDFASLPASIEVVLAPGVRDVIAMSPSMRALRDTAGVVDVVVEAGERHTGCGAIHALGTTLRTGATGLAVIAIMLAIAAMRGWLERDPAAYRVFDLLGASPGFSAGPIVLAGALLGGCAALFAAIFVCIGIARWSGTVDMAFPSGLAVLGFLGIGVMAGGLAGGLTGVWRASR